MNNNAANIVINIICHNFLAIFLSIKIIFLTFAKQNPKGVSAWTEIIPYEPGQVMLPRE